jgi:hypothetical protein
MTGTFRQPEKGAQTLHRSAEMSMESNLYQHMTHHVMMLLIVFDLCADPVQ